MRLLFFSIAILATTFVHAQTDTAKPAAVPAATPVSPKHIVKLDSLKTTKKKQEFYKETFKRVRRKFDSTLFTNVDSPTTSDYAEDLERVYQLLNHVPVVTETFVRLAEIDAALDEEDSAIDILKNRMSQNDRTFNVRNLQMFNTLLDELSTNVHSYGHYLLHYDTALDGVRKEIATLKKDTLMLRIFRDSALKDTFALQLAQLKSKWRQADSLIALNSQEINALKSEASSHAISIQDLGYRVDQELKAVGSKAFGKERRYLWEPRSAASRTFNRESLKASVDSEQQLARYYFTNTRHKRAWILLIGIMFFLWVRYNYRSMRRRNKLATLDTFQFSFIKPYPIAATLVFILSLAPLFDLHAPAIYIESVEFLLMIVLTFVLYKQLPGKLFYGWCLLLVLFLFLPVVRILGLPLSMERWAMFFIDIASLAAGLFFLVKGMLKSQKKIVHIAVILYSLMNLLAIWCNLFGRVTLAQILSTTAVYSVAETVSVAVFVRLVVEAFLLQIQASRVRKDYPDGFDLGAVSRSIYRFAITLAVLLWLIVFTTNLNLFDSINDLLYDLFTTPREIGNFSFTVGGLVLFLGIIWLANFLQRYIAYFFGDTGDDAALDDRGQRSRLLVTRLVLLIGGFLLAVAASGLSVDRITVILGALGVGVGLGLQNIVNNFVSGIILIFDRPVRIGDTVELGDKRGRVKEIGIRSSTLLTEEGAEVIIPNGDVLSSRIVNWTLSNNHVRVALAFTVEKPAQPDLLNPDEIKAVVKNNPNVLERRDPEVLLNTLTSKSIELKIFFWIKDITRTTYTSGEIRTEVYRYLDSKGLVVS